MIKVVGVLAGTFDSKVVEAGLTFCIWLLDRRSGVWILIEILIVGIAGKLGHPRRLDLFGINHCPVNTTEPGVLFDILRCVRHAAQPLRQV